MQPTTRPDPNNVESVGHRATLPANKNRWARAEQRQPVPAGDSLAFRVDAAFSDRSGVRR